MSRLAYGRLMAAGGGHVSEIKYVTLYSKFASKRGGGGGGAMLHCSRDSLKNLSIKLKIMLIDILIII